MKLSVVTCTGDRPFCLSLITKWINCQTKLPDQWLVIDDGKTPTSNQVIEALPNYAVYLRREPREQEPEHTLNLNIQYALPHIKGDAIVFCEDDEYYSPEYLGTMYSKLLHYEAVGICRSRYYNIQSFRSYTHSNREHASLAQTGIQKSFLKELANLLEGDPFIDIRIWSKISGSEIPPWGKLKRVPLQERVVNGRGLLFDDSLNNKFIYVGMKGMPGRAGIGSGHKTLQGAFDANCNILKKWISIAEHHNIYIQTGIEMNKNIGKHLYNKESCL